MKKKYTYSEHTYNSKNLLARFSHRTRFDVSIRLVLEQNFKSILDYGAGDNKFLEELKLKKTNLELNSYEPIMQIEPSNEIQIYSKYEDLGDKKFDVITCFETLEHFNERVQTQLFQDFREKLNDNGRVIISVPIEIGFPSLVKNIRRMSSGRGKRNYYTLKNAIKCLFAQPVPDVRQMEGFIPSHIGFNHNTLEKIILRYFKIQKNEMSPFKKLSAQFNSQVFYVLEKK